MPDPGDRIRVRDLPPGTWAASMAGQEGEVELVEGIDMLVRMDGEPVGGVLAWLQDGEVDVLPRESSDA
jgi:hypothetical protein